MRTENKVPLFQIPVIQIDQEPDTDDDNFIETSSIKSNIANNVQNNNYLNNNYNNKNSLHPDRSTHQSSPKDRDNEHKEPPTFEELSGGLHPNTTKVSITVIGSY